MSICETCKNSFSDRDEIHCKAMNGCRVDGLDFTHCKHYDEEQGPGFSVQLSGGTVWHPDMIQKPKPPPNAERLHGLDRTNMEDAFIHLFTIHERHRNGTIYSCQTCPLCDQAICAYSALVAMCQATGVNIEEIKNLWLTPGQEAHHG